MLQKLLLIPAQEVAQIEIERARRIGGQRRGEGGGGGGGGGVGGGGGAR